VVQDYMKENLKKTSSLKTTVRG